VGLFLATPLARCRLVWSGAPLVVVVDLRVLRNEIVVHGTTYVCCAICYLLHVRRCSFLPLGLGAGSSAFCFASLKQLPTVKIRGLHAAC